MRKISFAFASVLLASLLLANPQTQNHPPQTRQSWWIFFQDKGPQALSKASALVQEAEQRLTRRALERRAKVRAQADLIDETDFALYQPYLDELAKLDLAPVVKSRWLNAVSVSALPEQIDAVKNLSFVKAVRRVAHLKLPPVREAKPKEIFLPKVNGPHRYSYGASLSQMNQIVATTLHDAGITGRGVLVGMMDTGFEWQTHEAFAQLRVIAEHDFINDDDVTRNEGNDPAGQDSHGTQTLSTIAGFLPGELIGPAFDAKFLLAKTEYVPTETHAEEQYWVEAAEWMEAQGVEVTSTSLGYSTFDPGQTSYSTSDMDGKTTIITIAAELAASKGVIVVNSAGNEGGNSWNIITAPADGPNVIAVGAVNASGGLVSFSSRGPTADGRIKPDVMAMGSGVYVAVPRTQNIYSFASGTSFSCPLTAGVVAQIVSAHPEVTPKQMLALLHATSSRGNSPNNDYGHGIVNAKAAITALGPAFSNVPEVDTNQAGVFRVTMRVLSRDGVQANTMKAHYAETPSTNFTAITLTQVDSISYAGQIPRALSDTAHVQVYFTATDHGFGNVIHPKTAPAKTFLIRKDGTVNTGEIENEPAPRDFTLEQSRPNPFVAAAGNTVTFAFALTQPASVRLRVYNVLGQEVVELVNAVRSVGRYRVFWDGRDAQGRLAPSGVYFYVLTSSKDQTPTVLANDGSGTRLTGKMLIVR
jgi:subtilisin family serine protease